MLQMRLAHAIVNKSVKNTDKISIFWVNDFLTLLQEGWRE